MSFCTKNKLNKAVPITAYQDPAFFLSILSNEPGYECAMYNSYINFIWDSNNYLKLDISVDYGEQASFYLIQTIMLHNAWDLISRNNPYSFFINLIANKIHSGWYITGRFDEFYISSKKRFKKDHYNNQFYLFGADNNRRIFNAIGTDIDQPYSEYEISFEELEESIKPYHKRDSDNDSFTNLISFVKNKHTPYFFNSNKVFDELKLLLNLDNNVTINYGFSAVEYFINNFEKEYKREYVILICEHAKLMYQRLLYIQTNNILFNISEVILEYKEINFKSDVIINLANQNNKENITIIKANLYEIIQKEKGLLLNIFQKFEEHKNEL